MGRDLWDVERDGGGILQGRRVARKSLLVEALLTNPCCRASVTDRLCGVAFLAQPRLLSETPPLSINIGREPFFFDCCEGDKHEHAAPRMRRISLAHRQGIQASPLRKLSLVGFEVGAS